MYSYTKVVNIDRLSKEIRDSSIKMAFDFISVVGESVEIHFKSELDTADQSVLDGLVASHTPTPLTAESIPVILDTPKNQDGRQIGQSTPRVIGTYTVFAGQDDDHLDPTKVGGANTQQLNGHHLEGDPLTKAIYADFNTIINTTYLHEGFLAWYQARNDRVSFELVPKTTPYTVQAGTAFMLYGGYLVIPVPAGYGNVSVNINDMVLVQCVANEFGNKPAGYWNATFNSSTKLFENITPALDGKGNFNIFGAEVVLGRFASRVSLLGDSSIPFMSTDVTQLGHNMRVKIVEETVGADHEWYWSLTLSIYRSKTC